MRTRQSASLSYRLPIHAPLRLKSLEHFWRADATERVPPDDGFFNHVECLGRAGFMFSMFCTVKLEYRPNAAEAGPPAALMETRLLHAEMVE